MAKEKSPLESTYHGTPQATFDPPVVEDRGWLTTKQQVDRLMAAGMIQSDWKHAHFAEASEVPDDFIPPGYAPTEMELIDEARRVLAGKTLAEARKEVHEAKEAGEATGPVGEPESAASVEEAKASGGDPA